MTCRWPTSPTSAPTGTLRFDPGSSRLSSNPRIPGLKTIEVTSESGQAHLTDSEALAANTVIPLQGNDGRQGGIYDTAVVDLRLKGRAGSKKPPFV
ncbi:MAG: hypothetical protein LBQ81_06025 [Zoogloeaceae bacterium]|jgi:hypothetical protein|nr:hypothetical protein [Zoogloeaceae bacterium]